MRIVNQAIKVDLALGLLPLLVLWAWFYRRKPGKNITLLNHRWNELEDKLDSVMSTVSIGVVNRIEKCINTIYQQISGLVEELSSEIRGIESNPMRNYSFQKRYFDWDKRERWHHYLVYQSFRFAGIK